MSQELRRLTKQRETRVVRETFCPPHTQLCALYLFVYFLMEKRRLMDEIKKRDV